MRVFAIGWVILATCKAPPAPTEGLLNEVRVALSQRESRFAAYYVHIETVEAGQTAAHDFTFRAPSKLRGDVTQPQRLSLSFDGTTLFTRADGGVEAVTLELPAAKAATLLATTFHPFVPEGFRSPLIPRAEVTAAATSHALERNAVAVTVIASAAVQVHYTLRLPNGDFLAKRVVGPQGETTHSVTAEQCITELRLCLPTRIVITEQGREVAITTMSAIDAGHPAPTDVFRLEPAPGELLTKRTLTEKM
jgi:hypothetical protein